MRFPSISNRQMITDKALMVPLFKIVTISCFLSGEISLFLGPKGIVAIYQLNLKHAFCIIAAWPKLLR